MEHFNPELSGGRIPLQDKYCHKSVAEAERNPFFSARDLKAATGFPGQKDTIISRLKQQVSGNGMPW